MITKRNTIVRISSIKVRDGKVITTLMLACDKPDDYSGVIIDGTLYKPVYDSIPGWTHVSFVEKEPIVPQSNEIDLV